MLKTTDLETWKRQMTADFLVVCDKFSTKVWQIQTKTGAHQYRSGPGQVSHQMGRSQDASDSKSVLHLAPLATTWCWCSPGNEKSGCCHAFVRLLRKLAHSCLLWPSLDLQSTECFLPAVVETSKEESPLWPVRKCSKVTLCVLCCRLLRWGVLCLAVSAPAGA